MICEVRRFCVRSEDLTNEELVLILERCVELGATPYDWVEGFDYPIPNPATKNHDIFLKDQFKYWGVGADYDTYTSDHTDPYEGNVLTKEEAFKMMNIETEETEMTGNKLKPFCIESDWVTEEELNQILKKCVELGAHQYEWVDGFGDSSFHYNTSYYRKDLFLYWGVDTELNTLASDECNMLFANNLLTKGEAFEMLGIEPCPKEEKEDSLLDKVQKANCSLIFDHNGITIYDKDIDSVYNIPCESKIIDFIDKLMETKMFLSKKG